MFDALDYRMYDLDVLENNKYRMATKRREPEYAWKIFYFII